MSIAGRDWKSLGLGLLEVALLVTAAFSVATCFDEWHRLLEMFSHFRLQYFAAGAVLTIAFLWLRWAGYAAIGVATIALNGWFVIPWFLPGDAEAGDGQDITILHANVLYSNTDSSRFLELVDDVSPDIIIMQEATETWIGSLSSLHAAYPYRISESRDDAFGISLFSRHPVGASAINDSASFDSPEIVATIVVDGRELQLISAHPMPPIGNSKYGARNLQLEGLARLAAKTPEPLVLVGDLNITMWSHHYQRFEADSGLRNARMSHGIEPTWPLFFPVAMIPIDHVLVSKDVEVTGFRAGPNIGSDHLPIIAELRF